MGWVEERWAARGWGGGEGKGIMELTEAAARKGTRRKNEQAQPLPSSLLQFRFSHLHCGLWDDVPQPQTVYLASLVSWKVSGEVVYCVSVLQREAAWFQATLFSFF